jgi:hypothetical protein
MATTTKTKTKTKRFNKRHYKKHRTYKRHTKRRLYRKKRDILTLPGSKGVPLFMVPEKTSSQSILVNQRQSGNMIPGLRNM